jgi:hypothetical protein
VGRFYDLDGVPVVWGGPDDWHPLAARPAGIPAGKRAGVETGDKKH